MNSEIPQVNALEKIIQIAKLKGTTIAVNNGEQSLSYKELIVLVQEYSDLFRSHHIKRLGIYVDNSVDWIAIDLAAMSLQIPVVPIPHFFSEVQKNHILNDACLDAVIMTDLPEDHFQRSLFGQFVHDVRINDQVMLKCDVSNKAFNENQHSRPLPQGTIKITYTSGSTGSPKGVCLSNQLISDTTNSLNEAIDKINIGKHLSLLPYSTLLENIAGVYVPLTRGATVYCLSMNKLGILPSLQLDPMVFATAYNEVNPQSVILTPQLLELLCGLAEKKLIDIQQLQFVALGGAHCSKLLLKKAAMLNIPVYQGYGLSECGSVVSLSTPKNNKLGAVGKALSHVQVKTNEQNQIIVNGNQFGAYLGVDNEFPTEINTGDIGFLDKQNYLHIHGRKSNLLVLATGRNVSPEWVESELLQQLGIAQCLVYGDGNVALSAIIVSSDEKITDTEIQLNILNCNQRLPAYAQIEKWMKAEKFTIKNNQLTANGKLVRQQIMTTYYHDFSLEKAVSISDELIECT